MEKIDHVQPNNRLILPDNDFISLVQPSLCRQETLRNILHSSVWAIWKLSRQNIVSFPCHTLLSFSFTSGTNSQGLAAINPKSIKQILTFIVMKTTNQRNQNQNRESQHNQANIIQGLFSKNAFHRILRKQFQKILSKVMVSLNSQLRASSNIQVQWKEKTLQQIFESNFKQLKKCRSVREFIGLETASLECKINREPCEDKLITQFKGLLCKLSGNSKAKLDIYKLFQSTASSLKAKNAQIQQWTECCKQLQQTVNNQMSWIQFISQENSDLEHTIEGLRKQLQASQERLKKVQNQISELQGELSQLKIPAAQSYYINPYYEKSQMQQKMFMEMIELQSELILGKDQIRIMTDAIVELVKHYQTSLQDFPASKFLTSKLNHAAFAILKDIKSLQGVDLQGMMNLKEGSIYSEYFQQARKSLSSCSQIELDTKQSRVFTEDDSLSGEQ